jgi:hypothetical protein
LAFVDFFTISTRPSSSYFAATSSLPDRTETAAINENLYVNEWHQVAAVTVISPTALMVALKVTLSSSGIL